MTEASLPGEGSSPGQGHAAAQHAPAPPPGISRPSPARPDDNCLGGTSNFAVDPMAAGQTGPRGAGQIGPPGAGQIGPWGLTRHYRSALARNSCRVLSHATAERIPSRVVAVGRKVYARATETVYLRTKPEIARLIEGTELIPPCQGAAAELAYAGAWGAEDPDLADSDGSRGPALRGGTVP